MAYNDFLREVPPGETIHNYSHAAYVFRSDAFRLHPKFSFLFWVRIKLFDYVVDPALKQDNKILGALAKTVNLPRFAMETKTLNAYNRVNLVQTKIKYDPVTIKFHDDGADVVRKFWYDYYSYYFRDSDYLDSVYHNPHKYNSRTTDGWGYTLRNEDPDSSINYQATTQYIQSIEIFSFHKKEFNQVTLQNPIITSFKHGDHDMAGTVMENEMTFSYETVNYASGYLSPTNFGDDMLLLYDKTPSTLASQETFGTNGQMQASTDTVMVNGSPQTVTAKVIPFSYGDTTGGSLNTTSMSQSMSQGFPSGSLMSGSGVGAVPSGLNLGTLTKIGTGLATGMITNLMRGRKPNGKINAPTISNLLYQAGDIAGGSFGAQLKAAGGLTRAGAAIARGGVGPGNMGTAVVAINSAAALFGKKPQDFLPGGKTSSVTSNGQRVGNPLYSSSSSMIPSFPSIGASSPSYGTGGVQVVPTPAVVKAYSGNYSYSDSRATMNDASQLTDVGNQGSFTI
jgi:hypothetical protein